MDASAVKATPCQPLIGAEISGVDLRQPIGEATAEAIRQALWRYGVIVFRDQPLTREQHYDFANIFVRNRERPFAVQPNQATPVADYPELVRLVADGVRKVAADIWHSDESYRPWPSTVSVLRGCVMPSIGGDTVFASNAAAYRYLPDEVKTQIQDLDALHAPAFLYAKGSQSQRNTLDPAKFEKHLADAPPVAQPMVIAHPETGEPVLFVNYGYTGRIVGMEEIESEKLLSYLHDRAIKPDYQFRLRWTPDTVVVWDNLQVQHYATADYDEPRIVERLLVAGHQPVRRFPGRHAEAA